MWRKIMVLNLSDLSPLARLQTIRSGRSVSRRPSVDRRMHER